MSVNKPAFGAQLRWEWDVRYRILSLSLLCVCVFNCVVVEVGSLKGKELGVVGREFGTSDHVGREENLV
ncbi:hypothetical protein FRX31_035181 [Thalictrum thalictroides]|uniref:Transmembrane protein n=1 Tax=Thalictrum thalictroides TaxID=46969 RepID=A0A7J6USH5_THATH|nr:hypothetical protein FRX31_035181 [Thalictrum thalictroides]